MTTQTLERADGLAALNTAIEKIKEAIEGMGGIFKIQRPVSRFIQMNLPSLNLNLGVCMCDSAFLQYQLTTDQSCVRSRHV